MAEARSVVVRLTMEAAQYIATAQKVGTLTEGAMTKAERATEKQSRAINTLGSQSGKAALVAAAGLAAMGKAAIDWESQFAGVEKTVDGTTSQLAALEGELRNLATTMPATHQEIAGVAEAAGQLGVAREDISEFTETMVQLGETTNLTAEGAATDIAQMANVLGTMPDEIDNVGAALVALGNDGASTEAQILSMAQRIAGAGAQIGLAESEILAIANAAASMGIEVEAGGSAISRVFVDLAKATAQGGPKLEKFAEIAGMSADEFTRLFDTDPARAFEAFTSGLDRVNKSGGDVFTVLDQLGLEDVRVSRALLSMAASGDLLSDSLDLGAKAFEENTALADEYAKRLDTGAADIRIAWNKIKDAGIQAGTALLPVISEVAGVVGGMASAFKALPAPVQGSVTSLLAVTAVVGGAAWFGAKVIGGVTDTRRALADLAETSPRAATGLSTVAKAGAALAAFEVTTAVLGQLTDMLKTPVNQSSLTRDLEALSDGHITDGLQDLSIWLGDIDDKWQRDANPLAWVSSIDMSGFEDAEKGLGAIDDQLASLVESGQEAKAADIFATITREGLDAGLTMEQITEAFGDYNTAVQNARTSVNELVDGAITRGTSAAAEQAVAAEANAAAWDQVVRATAAGGDAAVTTADDVTELTRTMRDMTSAALGAFDATSAWGQAVMDAREQAASGEKGLDEFTEAGQRNRAIVSDLASTWNSMPKSVQNSQKAYESHRKTFIDMVAPLVGSRKAARALADEMLNIPRKTVKKLEVDSAQAAAAIEDTERGLVNLSRTRARAIIDADNDAAINAINETKRLLGLIPDEVVNINIRRNDSGDVTIGPGVIPRVTPAAGGYIRGPGTTTSDSIPARLSNKEYVVNAKATAHYGVNMMHDINAMRFANGGSPTQGVGTAASASRGSSGRSVQELLAIAEALSAVRDLRRQLAADGKDKLSGHERILAELRLKVAEQEYRVAKKAEAREDAQKAIDALRENRDELQGVRSDLRGVGHGFSLDSIVPGKPLTVAQGVASELADLKRDIRDAGGKWTKAMGRWAADLIDTARELDHVNAQIVAETAARDQLAKTLDDQQQALDQLTSTMESFSDQVASNFLSNPFNQSGSSSASPELDAARAELAAIRGSGTGDSASAAARAEQLIHQIAQLGGESSGDGLAAFDATVEANTRAARDMAAALQTLQDKGLDPLGALYGQLASSGDILTAQQLAALTIGEIDAREAAFTQSQNEAAATAALATQAIYGQDHAELVAQVQSTTAAISASDATLARLDATAATLGAEVRAGASEAVGLLQPQIDKLTAAINKIPHQIVQEVQKLRR